MTINPKFKELIPPLSQDEYKQLEENILADGIRDPLVVWGDVLVDGHNRYEIAQKHNLTYQAVQHDFIDENDAVLWIIRNQLGRRNILPYVRTELALKLKPVIAAKAKEQQKRKPADFVLENSPKQNPIDTREEIASIANVSSDTVKKVEKIQEKATEEVKQQLRNGEISINKAYQDLRKQEILERGSVEEVQALYDESKENADSQTREVFDRLAEIKYKVHPIYEENQGKAEEEETEHGLHIVGNAAIIPSDGIETRKNLKSEADKCNKPDEPETIIDFHKQRNQIIEQEIKRDNEDFKLWRKFQKIMESLQMLDKQDTADAITRCIRSEVIDSVDYYMAHIEECIDIFNYILTTMRREANKSAKRTK